MPYLLAVSLHFIVVLIGLLFAFSSGAVLKCEKENSCKCNAGLAWSVDLTPLDVGSPPKYSATAKLNDTWESTIYFHPCRSFWNDNSTADSCGEKDGDVAVCLVDLHASPYNYTVLGVQLTNAFTTKGSFPDQNVTITYSSKTGLKKTAINLKCDKEDVIGTLKFEYYNNDTYFLTLASRSSCANFVPHDNGLSVGSVLLILFFVVLLLYLIVGMVFNHYIMGATGFEIIPHYEFWIDFPFLVRDGVVFLCKGCKTEPAYDRI